MEDHVKIQWLTKSPSMKAYLDGDKSLQLSGGRLYELLALDVLSATYDVSINSNFIKKENPVKYLLKKHKKFINADVCILDPYILAYGKFDALKKNIAIIHHVDEDLGRKGVLGKVFLKRMIANLKNSDLVVVVSEFWKDYLEKKGIKNIEIIYNSYNLNDFNFSEDDKLELKSKMNIDEDKPIVYLGKNGLGKGIDETLKHIDPTLFNLIVTGKKPHKSNVISTHFFTQKEFPVFLALCDVVLTMSTMQEGWNRIAHESLLVKTPVIGSGSGGMKELLTKSNQIILNDWSTLNAEIEKAIKNNEYYGNSGFDYVSQFNLDYFGSRWKETIENIL